MSRDLVRAVEAASAAVQRALLKHPELARPGTSPYGLGPLAGHCYVAAEALYHLIGREAGFKPASMKWEGATHWFLRKGHIVVDPTAAQFRALPAYEAGRGRGFLTREPSKRARIVLDELRGES